MLLSKSQDSSHTSVIAPPYASLWGLPCQLHNFNRLEKMT